VSKKTCKCVKRDLWMCQKRSVELSKETYISGNVSKETYISMHVPMKLLVRSAQCDKRDLWMCQKRPISLYMCEKRRISKETNMQQTATNCNTLQHTATHPRIEVQHTATHCNTLQHTATHCNTLPHTRRLQCSTLPHPASHCNTLQYDQKLQYTYRHIWHRLTGKKRAIAQVTIAQVTKKKSHSPGHKKKEINRLGFIGLFWQSSHTYIYISDLQRTTTKMHGCAAIPYLRSAWGCRGMWVVGPAVRSCWPQLSRFHKSHA